MGRLCGPRSFDGLNDWAAVRLVSANSRVLFWHVVLYVISGVFSGYFARPALRRPFMATLPNVQVKVGLVLKIPLVKILLFMHHVCYN